MERIEQLRPYSVPCFDYIGADGVRRKVSAIIVPIGFERKNDKFTISWACSKALSCRNNECRYSRGGQFEGGLREL
ncbi:MAG: hypothetical protein QXX41_00185 [Nitrososphaerota archaeon]